MPERRRRHDPRNRSALGSRRAREVGEENVFDFAIGSPSADPPAALHDAMRRLMETVPPAELHTYVPAPGLPSVRAKVADFLNAQFFMDYRPEDICLTDGASSALALVARALLSPGEEVVIPTPAFPEYWVYVESVGGVVKPVPCLPESFRLDLAALEAAITPKTVLVLLNSPNNPSGAVYPREDLEVLTAMLKRRERELGHPIYLLADEPYRELVYGGAEVPFLPALYPDTLYCYSFSKSLSIPGERVGFLAFHPEMAERDRLFDAVQGAMRMTGYLCVSPLFQLAAAECLGVTADISVYERNRDLICSGLRELGYRFPEPRGATARPSPVAAWRRMSSWFPARNSSAPVTSALPTAYRRSGCAAPCPPSDASRRAAASCPESSQSPGTKVPGLCRASARFPQNRRTKLK